MSGLNNNNSSKQRQVSGSGATSGLRVIVPSTTATNVIGPPMSSSPATGRNLLVPLRDTSGSRDSPTMQMAGVNGGGSASNPNRNSFGGPSTPGSQPNSSRMVCFLSVLLLMSLVFSIFINYLCDVICSRSLSAFLPTMQ